MEQAPRLSKYNVTRLVYFEGIPLYADAIRRENQSQALEAGLEAALIDKANPTWEDLIEGWNR